MVRQIMILLIRKPIAKFVHLDGTKINLEKLNVNTVLLVPCALQTVQTITNFGMAKQVVVICWLQMKKPIVRCALAANTNTKLNKLPALIVLLAPLERLITMMMTHGMVGQITMLQMKKLIVLYAHLVNTNIKLNKLPVLIVLLAPLERLMTMMMTHGMVGQTTMLQMQKLIVLYAHLVNTNIKLNKLHV